MFEYYLPGVDHRKLTDEEFAQKYAHLGYIRGQEARKSQELAMLGLPMGGKKRGRYK